KELEMRYAIFKLSQSAFRATLKALRQVVSFARYSALTSSLALKAHRAFNFEQAQRSELPFRATL
ncbi:hypothetical protein, partial [Gardnerella pickettii]